MTSDDDPLGLLGREAALLVERLRLWTPARWQASTDDGRPRAEVARHLAQWLADVGDAGSRRLPDLPHLSLPDQLAVTADDLVRTAPEPRAAALATAHVLLHRRDLLGDDVPAGLDAALRRWLGAPALEVAREACSEAR